MRKIIYKGDDFADYGKYYDPKQINVVMGPRMSGKTFSMGMRNIHIPNIQVYGECDDVAAILYSTLLCNRASYVCAFKETDFIINEGNNNRMHKWRAIYGTVQKIQHSFGGM